MLIMFGPRANHGDWVRFDIHLEILQPVLTLIPVAAAYVRNFSSIEERHNSLQQGSILAERNLKSKLLGVVVPEWFHNLNSPNTRYDSYISPCGRFSIDRTSSISSPHYSPCVTSPLNDLPVAGRHNCYQWVRCEQAVDQPFVSKQTNHVRLALKISMSRQFRLYVCTA